MITGVFLRYFKTYSGTNYIPLSSGSNFCGLVGNNGIGKSSILEAFDTFFNGKNWNTNSALKKASAQTAGPHIVPIFMIKKSEISERYHAAADVLTQLALKFDERSSGAALTPTTRLPIASFSQHINKLKRNNKLDDYFIIPIGCDTSGGVNLSILNSQLLTQLLKSPEDDIESLKLKSSALKTHFEELLNFLKNDYEYIYIPKDIDPEIFTKLETSEIQKLMGESLEQIIQKKIPKEMIGNINTELNNFISQIENELEIYSYRTSGSRQQNLKRKDVYNLIIDAFFRIRKLNRRDSTGWIEISSLSSGEKQRAIIDLAQGLLTNHRENGDKLLIGIDEPECSLHMSACFEQFDNLFKMSENCRQIIFTTHWYGYLPTVENGCTTSIIKDGNPHQFFLYDLAGYREEIKQNAKKIKEKIPYDIRIKSTNDLIQSIISSTLVDSPYNWLICEGSTEKVYLSYYFKDIIESKKLRIVPVGGAKEVKKIFQLLEASHDDLKKDVKGKVLFLSDTDREILSLHVNNIEKIKYKRIVNDKKSLATLLVDPDSVIVSPPTEIESCLNGFIFSETIKLFVADFPFLNDLISGKDFDNNLLSYFSMNLRPNEEQILDEFFNTAGVKYEFSKQYIEQDDWWNNVIGRPTPLPAWLEEIKAYFC